jgi:serine protease Do
VTIPAQQAETRPHTLNDTLTEALAAPRRLRCTGLQRRLWLQQAGRAAAVLLGLPADAWGQAAPQAAAEGPGAAASPSALPAFISAIKPSVLPVGTFSALDNPRFAFRGTGFVVGDGSLVATNFHVLPAPADLEAGPPLMVMVGRNADQGLLRRARVVATDRPRDLALLKLEGAALKPLRLEDPGAVREGQSVALMGYPIGGVLGFSAVTHRGIVASITTSALPAATAQTLDPRAVRQLREGSALEVMQLDATAYPGNSGGPVFDAETGRVLGIVNQVLVRSTRESALTHPTGITYAVPVRYLLELLKEVR